MNKSSPDPSSYRDPAGFIFSDQGVVYRQVNQAGKADFEQFIRSGLYDALADKDLVVSHQVQKTKPKSASGWLVIKPQQIPFISYPYEWSFDQLKDAALLTLQIQEAALAQGMILKDASAFNIQFIGKKPIFIDTLSFATYQSGQPWEGYRQFCEHFLTPLAVAHYSSVESLKMLESFPDGIPLALARKLLPSRARYKKGLGAHVYLHASSQQRHKQGGNAKQTQKKVSEFALHGLMHSLQKSISGLQPPSHSTEWDGYYDFTNYSDAAMKNKQKLVQQFLDKIGSAKLVWDLGANNGEFSQLAAARGSYTIAWDIDANAVDANYRHLDSATDSLHLPLVQDLVIPSPAIGWANKERKSFIERGPADVVLALALIHHLAIGRNVPLEQIADLLSQIGNYIIIEFVPKSDSKVKLLLRSRKDIFPDYTQEAFEKAMHTHFKLIDKRTVVESERCVYLYKVK